MTKEEQKATWKSLIWVMVWGVIALVFGLLFKTFTGFRYRGVVYFLGVIFASISIIMSTVKMVKFRKYLRENNL